MGPPGGSRGSSVHGAREGRALSRAGVAGGTVAALWLGQHGPCRWSGTWRGGPRAHALDEGKPLSAAPTSQGVPPLRGDAFGVRCSCTAGFAGARGQRQGQGQGGELDSQKWETVGVLLADRGDVGVVPLVEQQHTGVPPYGGRSLPDSGIRPRSLRGCAPSGLACATLQATHAGRWHRTRCHRPERAGHWAFGQSCSESVDDALLCSASASLRLMPPAAWQGPKAGLAHARAGSRASTGRAVKDRLEAGREGVAEAD